MICFSSAFHTTEMHNTCQVVHSAIAMQDKFKGGHLFKCSYFHSIHRIGIVVLRPLLNYHDACINWLASHQFVTNLRNPAYHESHQTLSTWVMLPTYHRSSFAAVPTVYFFLQTAILLSNRLAYCMFGSSHYCTLLFPPHAGVYVSIPSTCRCIRCYSPHIHGAPDTKVQHH